MPFVLLAKVELDIIPEPLGSVVVMAGLPKIPRATQHKNQLNNLSINNTKELRMALSRYPKMTLPYSLHFALHSSPLKLLYNKGQSTAAQRAYTALIVTGDVGIHSQFFFFPCLQRQSFYLSHMTYISFL